MQAGAGEAADGGVLEPRAVEAEAPQARVRRQQRPEQVVRKRHLLQSQTETKRKHVNNPEPRWWCDTAMRE